jgi:hypothetical protein
MVGEEKRKVTNNHLLVTFFKEFGVFITKRIRENYRNKNPNVDR